MRYMKAILNGKGDANNLPVIMVRYFRMIVVTWLMVCNIVFFYGKASGEAVFPSSGDDWTETASSWSVKAYGKQSDSIECALSSETHLFKAGSSSIKLTYRFPEVNNWEDWNSYILMKVRSSETWDIGNIIKFL